MTVMSRDVGNVFLCGEGAVISRASGDTGSVGWMNIGVVIKVHRRLGPGG